MKRAVLKKGLFTLIFAALLSITLQYTYLDGTAWAVNVDTTSIQDVSNKSFDTTVDNVQKYANFAAAITAIGGNVRTLLIPAGKDVSTNVTVPANIALLFQGDGKLNITSGTATVTINGPVQAPVKPIFSLTGKVSFSGNRGKLEKIYPQWWGAKGDGITDDTAAIQAAVNAAATIMANTGGLVFFPAGYYKTTSPIILPRSGDTLTNLVRLQGAGMKTTIFGSSAAGFPADRALIEWDQTAATRTWYQSIKDMTFSLPNVAGVSAIRYQIKDNSSPAAILSETLKIDLKNLLIYGDNTYHQRLVWLQGNLKMTNIENIYADCCQGTSATYDTTVLEVDSTWADADASGISGVVRNIQGGISRGGYHQIFKGRLCATMTNCSNRYGTRNATPYEIINGRSAVISNISNGGAGSKPQLKLDGCSYCSISEVSLGNPLNVGLGVGNGIEFVNTDDCSLTGHYRSSSDTAFSSSGVKNLVIDASSDRNRISNFLIKGSASNEIQNSGTDNY
ncbi:MAG: glycosyl hydrolase family 28-related protein, partial [bacterium]|nr:glycosyl hydrolase family 28-related protein [bacterium]